jgi:hypothetical protein
MFQRFTALYSRIHTEWGVELNPETLWAQNLTDLRGRYQKDPTLVRTKYEPNIEETRRKEKNSKSLIERD